MKTLCLKSMLWSASNNNSNNNNNNNNNNDDDDDKYNFLSLRFTKQSSSVQLKKETANQTIKQNQLQ